jgi:hypothetical protein
MAGKSQEDIPSEIAELFAAAKKLPLGPKRDTLLLKAKELEATWKVERWVSSSGLRPPREAGNHD